MVFAADETGSFRTQQQTSALPERHEEEEEGKEKRAINGAIRREGEENNSPIFLSLEIKGVLKEKSLYNLSLKGYMTFYLYKRHQNFGPHLQ